MTEESYKTGDYEKALQQAFLGTDEDLLASTPQSDPISLFPVFNVFQTLDIRGIPLDVPQSQLW